MTLRIHDTQSRGKRPFEPVHQGKVGMYVCGMTVQDKPHVGHLRSAVANDTIRRYLTYLGYQVTFVYNFTDIDDKIIARAAEEGVPYRVVAERNIAAYFQFADQLFVQRASVYPKATEHIPEILALIGTLVDKGFAYASGGDVYFDVRKDKQYGKLSGRDVDDLRSGARIEVGEEKRDPLDFTLWKGAKPGEPAWDSPWGPGRPGWHIECSAMSSKYLGETFDLHGGGQDLIFPHHENEIAQSESATGKPFVHFWLHNGMVTLGGQKMSKSEKRFFLIEDVLEQFRPEEIRFYLLSTHYRSPIEFNEERLGEGREAYARLRQAVERGGGFDGEAPTTASDSLDEAAAASVAGFHEAMTDDFNTAGALGHLFDLARTVNRLADSADAPGARAAALELRRWAGLMGLLLEGPRREEAWPEDVLRLVTEREEARKKRDWARADALRGDLLGQGILVEDGAEGPKLRRKES
ncbi:MAG TPA: cysteine--tRNA ligase [Candidatus Eisenbacteria bacterium]|nr:cysteine--tRNA ligase [Candidatus Eisenbacteria bacterium]